MSQVISETQVADNQIQEEHDLELSLPPHICTNARELVESDQIPVVELLTSAKKRKRKTPCTRTVSSFVEPMREPVSLHSVYISWYPELLYFELSDRPCVQRIWVSNRSARCLYIHVCGLWEETGRLGAAWRCWPRTNQLLAPGLIWELFIRASPRPTSPVTCALIRLQLAAAYPRNTDIAFFAVPIQVIFKSYVEPVTEQK